MTSLSWQVVELSNENIVGGEGFKIQEMFENLFMSAIAPKDAAMFGGTKTPSQNLYYFSPGCSAIADPLLISYSATLCQKPDKDQVALLVGHADSWSYF